MKKLTTKIIAVILAIAMLSVQVNSNTMIAQAADGDGFEGTWSQYVITDKAKREAQFTGVSQRTATWIKIPATVTFNGKEYKVTSIKNKALYFNTKVKKITIGANVEKIGKNAFFGCSNLKTITIETPNLTAKKVNASAFGWINKKAIVTVPEGKEAAYKKILKKKGLTGKNQKVNEKKMEFEDESTELIFDSENPLPEPEEAIASIGNIARVATKSFDTAKVIDSAKYSKGDSITFSARVCMKPDIYGKFCKRYSYGCWELCYRCDRKFSDDRSYAIHECMSPLNCPNHFSFPEDGRKDAYTETYWVSDDAPCKTVFHIFIPDGLSYKKDSIKVLRSKDVEIDRSNYHVEVSDQKITVTIDDIKSMPYFGYSFETSEYGGFRYPISILFDAEINDSVATINTVNASLYYSYKGMDKTLDLGEMSIYTTSLQIKNTDSSGKVINGSKFVLYKSKKVDSVSNVSTKEYFEITEAESINGFLSFDGIGQGDYKLVQTEVPSSYKKGNVAYFNVSIEGKEGNLTSLSAKSTLGTKIAWDADVKNGIINATIVNN